MNKEIRIIWNVLNTVWKILNPKHQILNKSKYLNPKLTKAPTMPHPIKLRGIVWMLSVYHALDFTEFALSMRRICSSSHPYFVQLFLFGA